MGIIDRMIAEHVATQARMHAMWVNGVRVKSRRNEIMAKVLARVKVDPVTGCWIWQGPTSGTSGRGHSYPRMNLDGVTVAVHKVTWTCEHGYIPPKKQLDHKCRNRLCVNPDPDHLRLCTHKQNQKWRDEHARKTKRALQCDPR